MNNARVVRVKSSRTVAVKIELFPQTGIKSQLLNSVNSVVIGIRIL